MKAAVFTQLGSPLSIIALDDPSPSPSQVVVKVTRCGICGSDLHFTQEPAFNLPAGTVLGHEYAGEIVATGLSVKTLKVKDRVVVMPLGSCGGCASCLAGQPACCAALVIQGGGYAQLACVEERQCLKLPMTISSDDAALVEPMAVGLHGVRIAQMPTGARVLVIGAGPIGLAATFWARRLGAVRVAVTATSAQRASLASAMGATEFILPADATAENITSRLGAAPDVIFECSGKPGLIARAVDWVRPRGTVLALGICPGVDHFWPLTALAKEVRVQFSALYDVREFETTIDMFEINAELPRTMVTDRIGLTQLPESFEALRTRSTQCKVLVNPDC